MEGQNHMSTEAEAQAAKAAEAQAAADLAAKAKADKEKPETVARADHERALADLQKFKKEAADLKREKETANETKLKEEKRWEELATARELETKEAKAKAENLEKSFLGERKYNAVRQAAEKLGLRPEAVSDLESLDLDAIQVETTSTGKINVLGAEKFAERVKTLKPHWFADKAAPNVNTTSTRITDPNGPVTARELLKAEADGKKTGDMTGYQEMHKKFQQQRLAAMRR